MEKITNFNNKMLVWARENSGFNITEIKTHKDFKDVEKWENSFDYPTYSQLKKLSSLYKTPIALFFFPEPPNIENLPLSCRTLPEDIQMKFSPEMLKAFNEARVLQLNVEELVGDGNKFSYFLSNLDINNTTEQLAKSIKLILHIAKHKSLNNKSPNVIFEYWRDRFYENGIYVFKNSFGDLKVSGFSLYDEKYPVIYINNSMSFTRQIFTLFHELYHLVKSVNGVDFINSDVATEQTNLTNRLIEIECNSFASDFLIPHSEFLDYIKGKDLNHTLYEKIGKYFGVSRETVVRRLLDSSLISNNEYLNLREEFNNDFYRVRKEKSLGNFYSTQLSYKGENYTELAYANYYNKQISLPQLSNYMGMKIKSLKVVADMKGYPQL